MHSFLNNSYLESDLGQLEKNARTILSQLPEGTRLIPVLKDDAYGLGMEAIAQRLAEIDGIRMLAVSHVSEGAQLRRAGYEGEILVMGGTPSVLLPYVIEYDLTLALGRLGLAEALGDLAGEAGKTARVQVKLETGLHRIGLLPGEELESLIGELKTAGERLQVTGAFTHFSDASDGERCREQYELLLKGVEQLEKSGIPVPMKHIAGSAGLELHPEFHLDAVRVGRRLYMDHPTAPTGDIGEVSSWRTCITNVRQLKAGEEVGYSGAYTMEHDGTIATVGVGYGDGLNPALAECHAPVLVNGQRARLLVCCMDQSMIDVTGIPCAPDDEVTFFGHDSLGNFLSSQEVANLIGDGEGCGLTSDLSTRVARTYIG